MIKKVLVLFVSFFIASLAYSSEILILPNIYAQQLRLANLNESNALNNKILSLVKNNLNVIPDDSYSGIRVRPVYANAKQVRALIIYFLSSQYKSVKVVRLNLNENLKVISVINNYHVTHNDLIQSPNYAYKLSPQCPDNSVQFVLGNNFKDNASVENEITAIYQLAKEKGYNPVLMDINNPKGPQPTVQAYANWFSCPNVKGFYNESHGYDEGIVLADDDFMFSMVDKNLVNKLSHNVIVFDSCNTFSEPLLSSMTDAKYGNAQKYMAGTISLPYGVSEKTAACFWRKAFAQNALTQRMVMDCASDFGFGSDDFEIKGHGSDHLLLPV